MKRILSLVAISVAFVAFWATFLGAEAGAQQPPPTPTPQVATPTPPPNPTATSNGKKDADAKVPKDAKVKKEFSKDDKGKVTWKLSPDVDANYDVWDPSAESCEAFGGASCGGIGKDGTPGKFVKGAAGQYLLVTQTAKVDGKTCSADSSVQYVAEPAVNPDKSKKETKASYQCSGATALGWPLLIGAFCAAVAAAWVLRKRQPWRR